MNTKKQSKAARLWFVIKNAFKMWWWAIKNPNAMMHGTFTMLSDLFTLIIKVATENRHMMTHIGYIHPDEGKKQIVSIWAGAGIGANPTKRIAELLEENSELKAKLQALITARNEPTTTTK